MEKMTAFAFLAFVISLMVSAHCIDVPKPHEVQETGPQCPSHMTKCGNGCCPVASAVCCSDGVHCCPGGYRCNYAAGGCTRGLMMSPFMEKAAYLTEEKISNDVQETGPQCPSHMTQCGNGCCPVASAVCCSDGVHCCPGGYTCNYAAGGCTRGLMMSPFLAKAAYLTEEKISNDVQETGPQCPSHMTKCGNRCCPVASAVCCSDGVHCCPGGYRCNYAAGGCTRGLMMSPFMEKAAYLTEEKVSNDVQETGPQCPSHMTQCGNGCCPVASAVCCSDGVHCCPGGYTCNYAAGGCTRGFMMSPFMAKATFLTEEKISSEAKEAVPVSQCPSYMTQCGSGCCPLPSAVCCSDGVHCCPGGYTCNYSVGGCTRGRMMSPFLEKTMF